MKKFTKEYQKGAGELYNTNWFSITEFVYEESEGLIHINENVITINHNRRESAILLRDKLLELLNKKD